MAIHPVGREATRQKRTSAPSTQDSALSIPLSVWSRARSTTAPSLNQQKVVCLHILTRQFHFTLAQGEPVTLSGGFQNV